MKKTIILLFIGIIMAFTLSAQEGDTDVIIDEPFFSPTTPEVSAQGNSYTAIAHGYNSLFTNPAGLSMKGGSFTLASATVNGLLKANPAELDLIAAKLDPVISGGADPLSLISFLQKYLTTYYDDIPINDENGELLGNVTGNNGIGAKVSAGLGFAGGGFGLGLAGDVEVFASGKSTTSVNVNAVATTSLVAGLSFPLQFGELATVHIGGDIRPVFRTKLKNTLFLTDALAYATAEDPLAELSNVALYQGGGVGFDLGTIIKSGPISIGMSVRDLFGTNIFYEQVTVSDYENVDTFPPEGTPIEELTDPDNKIYAIPMSMNIGLGIHPDLGWLKNVIDPTIHVEYNEYFYQSKEVPSFWTRLHAGAEVKLLSLLKVRGGINQGYLTLGAGLKLLFLDVNISAYTRELGRKAGDRPNSGVAIETAIRF